MKRIIPKKKWDRGGVSEIVGNLLILAITVTLFSSVLYFVSSMPTPNEEVYADFSSDLTIGDGNATISITHEGGETLKYFNINIYLFIDGDPTTLNFSDGGLDESWSTGQTWTHEAEGVTNSTSLRAMIVDVEENSVIWENQLNTGQGQFAPIIKQRGLTSSPTYEGENVSFYAKVVDPDGDLDTGSVYINASSIGLSNIQLNDTNNDGIFKSSSLTADLSWDGEEVTVHASDQTGKNATGRTALSVLRSPDNGGGGSWGGGGPGNFNYSGFQGFAFFNESDWERNEYNATGKTTFDGEEDIVAVVSSRFLENVDTENQLKVRDLKKEIIEEVSSPKNEFSRYDYFSGYNIFTATIDIDELTAGMKHSVYISLRDSSTPNNMFFAEEMITIEGSGVDQPTIQTYSDEDFNNTCSSFSTNDRMYVEMDLKGEGGEWDRWAGDVELRDFLWKTHIKRLPPESGWNGPVGAVETVSEEDGIYRFQINLANSTDQQPWIPGNNTYVLRYDMFGAGEETYLLSRLVEINAPKFKQDIVASVMYESPSAWSAKDNIKYYKNDNNWDPPEIIEGKREGTDKTYSDLVRLGDVTEDGKTDVVASVANEKDKYWTLYLYVNDGDDWARREIAKVYSEPTIMELGNIDYDNDLDLIVGFADGTVSAFRNDGLWTRLAVDDEAAPEVTAMSVGNLNSDGSGADETRSSDILVGRDSGGVTIYKNDDDAGRTWDAVTYSGGDFTYANDTASGESSIIGNVTGDYTDTTSQDGNYEVIEETTGQRTERIYPTSDSLKPDSENPFEVEEGGSLTIKGEDYSWGDPGYSGSVKDVSFHFKYETDKQYNAGDSIVWDRDGDSEVIEEIGKSKDWQTMGPYPLEGVNNTTALRNLEFTFENTDKASVYFDYWALEFSREISEQSLEHVWTFSDLDEGHHTLTFVGNRSSGGDTYELQYSFDNETYEPLTTVESTAPSELEATIPDTSSGTLYIKAVDTNRTSDNTPDELWVDYLKVQTKILEEGSMDSVIGTEIADLDGDGELEMAILDSEGTIYTGSLSEGMPMMEEHTVDNPSLISDAIGFGAGTFLGSDLMDLAITTTSKTYLVEQTSEGSYSQTLQHVEVADGSGYKVMEAGDVDGNGKTDLVMATDDQILIILNYGDLSEWERFLVDTVSTEINDLSIGRTVTY
ncbi:MAG: type IV pilin N-terminal domain-containing protein [Methanomassiliicoccales archaeon]